MPRPFEEEEKEPGYEANHTSSYTHTFPGSLPCQSICFLLQGIRGSEKVARMIINVLEGSIL